MRKLLQLIIIVLILLGANFCEHHHSSDNHHADAGVPVLDNGNRWKADAPTKEGFKKLKEDLILFEEKGLEGKSSYDYQSLSEKLNSDINDIFAACRMTGEAHNELHKFIALLQKDISRLKDDSSPKKDSLEELKKDVNKFETYFE